MIKDPSGEYNRSDAHIDAERCIAELQRGRAVALTNDSEGHRNMQGSHRVIQLIETIDSNSLEELISVHNCQLVLSRARAQTLDLLVDSSAVCLELAPDTAAQTLYAWAGLSPDAHTNHQPDAVGEHSAHASEFIGGVGAASGAESGVLPESHTTSIQFANAALNLAHSAHALPAFIMYAVDEVPANLLAVNVLTATTYADQGGELIVLSSARIPLASAESVELTVFRERHGIAEHVAIKVGEPDFSNTVTVRLHSSCFTGDILGSMKCDCGEQLQRAISTMAEGDGGVVLYVSQEGRGIGLASKLLAYQLQDQGLDTIEANQHLGFGSDERRYPAAVTMLEQLGINTIHLMTNNPLKIEALRQHGVNVVSRVPSPATVNVHNARYLETKRERAGHLSTCDSSTA